MTEGLTAKPKRLGTWSEHAFMGPHDPDSMAAGTGPQPGPWLAGWLVQHSEDEAEAEHSEDKPPCTSLHASAVTSTVSMGCLEASEQGPLRTSLHAPGP